MCSYFNRFEIKHANLSSSLSFANRNHHLVISVRRIEEGGVVGRRAPIIMSKKKGLRGGVDHIISICVQNTSYSQMTRKQFWFPSFKTRSYVCVCVCRSETTNLPASFPWFAGMCNRNWKIRKPFQINLWVFCKKSLVWLFLFLYLSMRLTWKEQRFEQIQEAFVCVFLRFDLLVMKKNNRKKLPLEFMFVSVVIIHFIFSSSCVFFIK